MSKYDWSGVSDNALGLNPGTYRVEVSAAEEKKSQAGNLMWVITLKALDFADAKLCQDNLMLPPSKGAGISKGKLLSLGFTEEELPNVEHQHLLGKRAWVTVKSEAYKDNNGNDRSALRVDISAKGSRCGFYSEKPMDVMMPVVAKPDEIPF